MIKWNTQNDSYLLAMLEPGAVDRQIDLGIISDDANNDDPTPTFYRGITSKKLKYKYNNNLPFWYMDTGYWGNYRDSNNFKGWKLWHRIVKNGLQHNQIIQRSPDRWEYHKYKIPKRKQSGSDILLVPASAKSANFYNIDNDKWIDETIAALKQYTDRPIRVRNKVSRTERILENTIFDDLDSTWCAVTYNSIAATESVLYGVPVITLAPNAADPVSEKHLENIENPHYPDRDLVFEWACHLAYGQVSSHEFTTGAAYKLLLEHWNFDVPFIKR